MTSEYINQKKKKKKRDDYVHWHCSIEYCVKFSLVDETYAKMAVIS